jgi:hypothetical protein
LSEFKTALIYLEQWELLNPGGHYIIPPSGKIDSPKIDIISKGSLGYLFNWFLACRLHKRQLGRASADIQSGLKRRVPLGSYYRLEYCGEDLIGSISTDKSLAEKPSERRERDCWSIYVKGYLNKKRQEREKHLSVDQYIVRCPSDSEVATILLIAVSYLPY